MKGDKKILSKEHKEALKNFAKNSYKVVIPVFGLVLSRISFSDIQKVLCVNGPVGYNEAVDAIMHSSMWADDKTKAVSILKRGESSEYYRAMISIVKSSMWADDKIKAMNSINKTE